MIVWNTLVLALRAIRRNGVRSLLTALGVVIGVASVITMFNLGKSATQSVTDQISTMGPNLLFVRPGMGRRGQGGTRGAAGSFDTADADAIFAEVAGVAVAPGASTSATVVFGNTNYSTSVIGTTNDFLVVRDWTLASGRSFEPGELSSGSPVCVLGQTVVEQLHGEQDPLGARMRVGRVSCLVIGVLEEKGESLGQDQDDVILMPVTAVQRRLMGSPELNNIYVSALEDGSTSRVKADIEALLRQRRGLPPGADDDFHVRDMQELAQTLQGATSTLTSLLAAIAAVSLVVGGIGIMNIMLVSVTERTREIGIRLAIGARAREVLLQFLVEAVVLSTLGGILGIGLGIAGTWIAADHMEMPFVVAYEVVVLSFAVSALIGVAFGFLPARKAAGLDPIDALRHE
jgi:putative ABC transport system permease protein